MKSLKIWGIVALTGVMNDMMSNKARKINGNKVELGTIKHAVAA